jgi:hypothetical protein
MSIDLHAASTGCACPGAPWTGSVSQSRNPGPAGPDPTVRDAGPAPKVQASGNLADTASLRPEPSTKFAEPNTKL